MNINEKSRRFDPAREITDPLPADRPVWRVILIYLLALLFLLAWAYFSSGCIKDGSGTGIFTFGGAENGIGTGSGDSGTGPGAGRQGEGHGKTAVAQVSGTGHTEELPGHDAAMQGPTVQFSSGTDSMKKATGLPEVGIESFAYQGKKTTAVLVDENTGGTAAGRKGFYGLDVAGKSKALFLIDVSGSMASASSEFPGQTRLDVLKMELKKSLFGGQELSEKSFSRSGGFIIIAFSSTTSCFPAASNKLCHYRNRRDMEQAMDFINALTPNGGTEMKKGWSAALKAADNDIDSIYFLTDGQPGDNFNAEWLLNLLRNKLPRIKVHCIAIGSENTFMDKIAKACRGKYIYLP